LNFKAKAIDKTLTTEHIRTGKPTSSTMPTERTPGTPIEAAPEGGPRGTTAEEEKNTTARALMTKEGFDPDDVRQADILLGW